MTYSWFEILTSDISLAVAKTTLALAALLKLAALTIWIERKASALIQDRIGANRAAIMGFSLAGLLNTLIADPVKALTKEDFVPERASKFLHALAPFLAVVPILVSFAVVPFGPSLIAFGKVIELRVSSLDAGLLYMFAMSSLSVYGVVLAGWVSDNKFSLFGGLRASAQMISYEVVLGLSVIPLLCVYATMDLGSIVELQSGTFLFFGLPVPKWGIVYSPIGFVLFFVAMMAETKRAPFDLPESESELVAGYFTEYSGMKFLLFWLGEFAEIVVAGTLLTVLFLGGWQVPFCDIRQIPADLWGLLPRFFTDWNFQWAPLVGAAVFGLKVVLLCVLQVVVHWTLPRFRYDQLMSLCWKIMLPIAMVNLIVTAAILCL